MPKKEQILVIITILLCMLSSPTFANVEYSHDMIKKRISDARNDGKVWVDNLEEYPFNLFTFNEFKSLSYVLEYNYAESPTRARMEINTSGYLDDSINGEKIKLTFHKINNKWEVRSLETDIICVPNRKGNGNKCL